MFINNNSTCYFQKVILSFCKPRMRVGQGETGGPVYLTDWQGAHSVARSPVIQQCAAPKMAAAAKAVKMSKFRPTMDQAKVTNTYFIIFCVPASFTRQLIMLCCIFSDKHVYWSDQLVLYNRKKLKNFCGSVAKKKKEANPNWPHSGYTVE